MRCVSNIAAAVFKSLLTRARKAARDHLPPEVSEAGRILRDTVVEHAPDAIADVVKEYVPTQPSQATDANAGASAPTQPQEEETAADAQGERAQDASASGDDAPTPADPPSAPPTRESSAQVLERVKTKADKGLKTEDSVVVVYTTPEFTEDAAAIKATFKDHLDATVREIDLDRERPQVKRQLAELTGAMVPPYVYINGRYWGGRYDMESLAASGDLALVVTNRLDDISDDARRIGNVRDSYSDEISVENILARWRLGHILCADDLDAWFEIDKEGVERFFYQGGPQDVDTMPDAAQEIVAAVEAEEYEATWQLEPTVGLP